MTKKEAQLMTAGYKAGFRDAMKKITAVMLDMEINEPALLEKFEKITITEVPTPTVTTVE